MNATSPDIVVLFLSIVVPNPAIAEHKTPIAQHLRFIDATRAEPGLPPLAAALPADRVFPVNLECNLVVPNLPQVQQNLK